jgi:hypothetical protein
VRCWLYQEGSNQPVHAFYNLRSGIRPIVFVREGIDVCSQTGGRGGINAGDMMVDAGLDGLEMMGTDPCQHHAPAFLYCARLALGGGRGRAVLALATQRAIRFSHQSTRGGPPL